ncbi:response regulator [Enemella sp. A6]|uniref:response regulator n=1 Tax=Enemella sp. A6 TaxID=3440152 RepID=UPI003EBEC30D
MNQESPIRVVVADDHNLVRAGLRSIIEVQPDMEVVGEAVDGREAAQLAERRSADVVLMDVSMPGTDGLAGLAAVRAVAPKCSVIMLTTFNVEESIERALRSGAAGYLLKTASAEQMLSAIRAAHKGERVFSRAVQDRLVDSYLGRAKPAPDPPPEFKLLTEREFQVFTELARGKSNAEIAKALFLSEGTVKTYVTRLLTKLGLRDRVQAVIFALQHGLLAEEEP